MPPRRATFDENSVPPWTRGDFRGVGAVTDNLVWVVDPESHPGASVKASQAFTPPKEGIFRDDNRLPIASPRDWFANVQQSFSEFITTVPFPSITCPSHSGHCHGA
jgi:hypothetical protein